MPVKGRRHPWASPFFKWGVGFHSTMASEIPDYSFGGRFLEPKLPYLYARGHITDGGMKHTIACVRALREGLGDELGLALDCGPGWTVPSAIRFAKAVEPYNVMWLEDLITGDYTPYTLPEAYRGVTRSTSTPIRTGEEVYLRQGFQHLIEKHAVNVIGPDPCDLGGIAELKWIAEYADLHGILIAPHGVGDGPFGLAALVQVSATLPQNYIAFEFPNIDPKWHSLVNGLPDPLVKEGFVEVPDRPGMSLELNEKAVRRILKEGETYFE